MPKFKTLFLILLVVSCLFVASTALAADNVTSITLSDSSNSVSGYVFSSSKTNYDVWVEYGAQVTITAKGDSGSSIEINEVGVGSNDSVKGTVNRTTEAITGPKTVTVTQGTQTYTLNFDVEPSLAKDQFPIVTVGGTSVDVSYNNTKYTAIINSGSKVVVSAKLADGTKLDGSFSENNFTLDVGGSKTVTFKITNESGTKTKTIDVFVSRPAEVASENTLKSLTLEANNYTSSYPAKGVWSNSFSSSRTDYTVAFATTATKVTITPTLTSSSASYEITVGSSSTKYTAPTQISLNSSGTTSVTIKVTAQDSSTKYYYLTLSKGSLSSNSDLSKLVVKSGSSSLDIYPSFSSDVTAYNVFVKNSVSSVTIQPTADQSGATITVGGTSVSSGSSTSVSVSSTSTSGNSVKVVVSAPDGSTKTYNLTVYRAVSGASSNNPVDDIQIRRGTSGTSTVSYDFNYSTYKYTVYANESNMRFKIDKENNRGVILLDGEILIGPGATSGTSSSIKLSSSKTTSTIVAVAPNYSDTYTYTYSLYKGTESSNTTTSNYLSDLDIRDNSSSTISYSPTFKSATQSYSATVNNSVSSITIRPYSDSSSSTIKVNGSTVASGKWSSNIALSEGSNNITILVTNSSSDSRTYVLTVTRNKVGVSSSIPKSIYLKIGQKTAKLDSSDIQIDAPPFLYKSGSYSYTMVPLRFISESLGAEVHYENATKKITITTSSKTLTMYANGKADTSVGMDVAPMAKDGRTYVPLRYVGEQLNCTVNWNSTDQSVTVVPK